jgi:DNA-binding NarL/FixJ family response regulator
MTTILVIDDDPYTELIVTAAVPRDWSVAWAPHGLAGLDWLQQHTDRGAVDLVILDITMPALDGYDTCARIRQLAPAIPILPYTSVATDPDLAAYLCELACAPLLRKGVPIELLANAIRQALAIEPHLSASGLLRRVQQQARETEARARRDQAPRIVIFAGDPLQRCGLRALLSAVAIRLEGEAATEVELRGVLMARRPQVLVAAGSDRAVVLVVAQAYQVPVVLVLPSASEAQALAGVPGVAGVVLASAPDAAAQLLAAVAIVAAGGHYHSLASPSGTSTDWNQSHAVGLTPQERRLLALDGPGVEAEMLAQAMGISRATILHYRSRIRRKMADAGVERRLSR